MAKKPVQAATIKNQQAPTTKPWLKCGELGTYAELNEKKAQEKPDPPKWERDHVPSQAAMLKAAQNEVDFLGLTGPEVTCIENGLSNHALTIAIPYGKHRKHSRTCGSKRNTPKQIDEDAADLDSAARKDLLRMQKNITPGCAEAYREAAKEIRKQPHKKLITDTIAKCTGG